jgi:putative membrane protein insertion efficiency factor
MKNWLKMLKKFVIKCIDFYQIFLSPMLGNNCRYYPSCSEYSKIQFELNNSFNALIQSIKRLLRCNQLFPGGIDYPIIRLDIDNFIYSNQIVKVKYWLVRISKNKYLVIKAENE